MGGGGGDGGRMGGGWGGDGGGMGGRLWVRVLVTPWVALCSCGGEAEAAKLKP